MFHGRVLIQSGPPSTHTPATGLHDLTVRRSLSLSLCPLLLLLLLLLLHYLLHAAILITHKTCIGACRSY
jgi:hypothetical protein